MERYFQHILEGFQIPLVNPILSFSLILLIILLAPIILRKFNIPGIIGLIISGVLIGPHGFGLLIKNSAVDWFSTIGLLYIMFIAGLDLDLQEFKSQKYKSITFGILTFIIPIGIGYPICFYLLGYGADPSLLTASMFATHTLIAYPIVSKLGITKNQAVAVTVGGTILTDVAVLLLLAIITGKHLGTLDQTFLIRLGVSMIILFAIMFKLIPLLTKWFFRKMESEKHSHYIFVLSVLFFSGFLAELAGVEPIIGAFIAGLSLNRLIPHSSPLMNRIEFIGNSLFIPFFLISVGMVVDISVIFNGPKALIVAGTLTAVALISKWGAAAITQLVFKYSPAQRQLIFGLSSSHAAATLAIILVGHRMGILDDYILNGTVILILITCVVASFTTEKAGKKILLDSDFYTNENLSKVRLKSEHILMSIALESRLEKLLEFTLLIKDKKSSNPVSVLTVVPNTKDAELNLLKTREQLQKCVKQASASESKVNVLTTLDYNISSGIIRTAREIMADIIIMGWPQQMGLIDKLIGEKADGIVNNTDKTVFMCHLNRTLITLKRIIVLAPPLTEKENGFFVWVNKVSKLSQELSLPITIYCNLKTKEDILKLIRAERINVPIALEPFDEWEDFLILSRNISADDFIFIISARKGSASYFNTMEQIPLKMDKHFAENNKVVIYPQQYATESTLQGFGNVTSLPFSKSLEGVQKAKKNIETIFKRDADF